MNQSEEFDFRARRYARIHFAHRLFSSSIPWTAVGFILGAAFRYLSEVQRLFPPWWCFPAVIIPPIAGIIASSLGFRGVTQALSWLDSEMHGHQELQAAWEIRDSESSMKDLVLSSGTRLITGQGKGLPVPRPGTAALMLSLAGGTIFLLTIIVGGTLFAPPGEDFKNRGFEMEEWAQSWAEAADGIGRPESRELAGRMGKLGRRMADGSIGERQAERALKALEEELEERRDELIRDKLAEVLVEDLGVDRESAEMFRVQNRRLPSDVLAELGEAVEGSTSFSEMDEEAIERLLSDPALRDRLDNGTPELTEELTQALQDALEPEDPRITELDKAAAESRKAQGEELSAEESRSSESPGESGSERGEGEDGDSTESGGGQTAGGGRGSSAVEDEPAEPGRLSRSTAEEPLRLPMESERTESWRTVIRAYAEENGVDPTVEGDISADWRQEVESAIHREDIPPGTRDYVRDYFTALEEGPEYDYPEE